MNAAGILFIIAAVFRFIAIILPVVGFVILTAAATAASRSAPRARRPARPASRDASAARARQGALLPTCTLSIRFPFWGRRENKLYVNLCMERGISMEIARGAVSADAAVARVAAGHASPPKALGGARAASRRRNTRASAADLER